MRPLSMWMSIYGEWGEAAPPPRSIPASATPTHQIHAAAGSPGCAQVSPDRHRRCTAPVGSPAAPDRWPPARRTHSPPRASHRLAVLVSEGIKALAAQLQQLLALGVAQLLLAHQVVGAPLVAGDAVEGEPCPPSA